jgi:hypothetical protein
MDHELEMIWKEAVEAQSRYWGNPQRTSVRIADVPADARTKYLTKYV